MTESHPDTYPDIEVYIKQVETPEVLNWLSGSFEITAQETKGTTTTLTLDNHIPCVILERAAKGGYTSVWFKENKTPWPTDEACAEAAFAHFNVEVRCSTGGWEGEDEAGWLRFTSAGKQTVNWLA